MSASRSTTSFWPRANGYFPSFFSSSEPPALPSYQPVAADTPADRHIRRSIRNGLIAHAYDALIMFIGTFAWMGVYYFEEDFEEIGDENVAYVLHCIAMGVLANLCIYPLMYLGRRHQDDTHQEALAISNKYLVLYILLDVLYQPTSDFNIAISQPDAFENFQFEKYTYSTFTPRELVSGFILFGAGFGLIYYFGEKIILRYSPRWIYDNDYEEELKVDSAYWNRVLRKTRIVLESTEVTAFKAAIQYFLFYLTDLVFNVDWDTFEVTIPQLLGDCAIMSAYIVALDNIPEILHILERRFYPLRTTVADDDLRAPYQQLPPDAPPELVTYALYRNSRRLSDVAAATPVNDAVVKETPTRTSINTTQHFFTSRNSERKSDSESSVKINRMSIEIEEESERKTPK